ncbi:hypothetical protein ASPCAL07579 [Aspergillus calidoustus]|uniref:CDP-diglyceride hydrolase n=1 Tax=Aspergillus calidoustus TaxID=454130 RepID=A0A0U5GS87_ASPCI|nr:hypothetical protein ASPCAL07579 [Aspergillus calidoustus]
MHLQRIIYGTLIVLVPYLTHDTIAADCSSQDIETQSVSSCTCGGGDDVCMTQCDATQSASSFCPFTTISSQLHLDDCDGHCTSDKNRRCKSCWIWFNALCSCYQNSNCEKSSNTGSFFWIQLNRHLLTTNAPIPSILDLQTKHSALAPFGWEFGQTQKISDPASQALVINSAHSITENQIHMHTCPVNSEMLKRLTELSTNPGPAHFSNLVSVTLPGPSGVLPVYCRTMQQKDTPVEGKQVSGDINEVMQKECKYYVGAAVMRDSNGYTWDCITADSQSTEYHRFCA